MALSRRSGNRFQGAIWPGYVDAVTGLLMVLTFVLTIFMVVQFVLRETISGQESELDVLTSEVSQLSRALGLERDRAAQLADNLGQARQTLQQAQQDLANQSALIASLTQQRAEQDQALEAARADITSFEAQVATLLAERDAARGTVADLTQERDILVSDQEALNLALAKAREEVDAGAEAARLAAARREALEALIADLERQATEGDQQRGRLADRVSELETALSDEETARLAEVAAAQALREKLETADAELTAMTLALEAERKRAEDTLTLLAAADKAQEDLDLRLAAALLELDETGAALRADRATLKDQLAAMEGRLQAALSDADADARVVDDLQSQNAAFAEQIATLQTRLEQAQETGAGAAQDRNELRATNQALGEQVAALQRRLDQAREAGAGAVQDRDTLRDQLAAALAAKLRAEENNRSVLSESEKRAALLAQANKELAGEQAASADSARRTTLLNQQVAQLRTQLGNLQGLLDDYKERDASNQVQIQSLGTDLNAALAQKAAEEKRRRELEEAERKRLEAERDQLERYKSEFFGQLRDVFAGQDGVQVVGDRFVFSSEVLFDPGSADLSEAGQSQIAGIAATLRALGNKIPDTIDWMLRVDGHTDDVPLSGLGEFRDNWQLSQARALSVVRYMVDFLGFPPTRLSANGFAQFQPIASGTSPQARAANRRIELKFTER